jgi:acyl-CoA synthetase (AMP-forming)/AMP-acid ligase II
VEVDDVGRQYRTPKLIDAGGHSRLPAAIGFPLGMVEDDVNLLSVPLSHNTGFTTAAAGLLLGHHLVIMPRFDPNEFLRLVTEHRVTFLATVPTVMQRLLPVYRAHPDAYDLSPIRRFWHLGAPCPPVIKHAWIEILGPEQVWELYGGTELQALTFISGDQYLRMVCRRRLPTLLLPVRSSGRHVHRRWPQRLPCRDRSGPRRASGRAVVLGRRCAR